MGRVMTDRSNYLKRHTETLVKELGLETACKLTGKSKATLGRYYSDLPEHNERFIPVDAVAVLEKAASYPHLTGALAELNGITLSYETGKRNAEKSGGVNADIIALSQRFAQLMAEYSQSIEDGIITLNESKRLLRETQAIQQVLLNMKLHLEEKAH